MGVRGYVFFKVIRTFGGGQSCPPPKVEVNTLVVQHKAAKIGGKSTLTTNWVMGNSILTKKKISKKIFFEHFFEHFFRKKSIISDVPKTVTIGCAIVENVPRKNFRPKFPCWSELTFERNWNFTFGGGTTLCTATRVQWWPTVSAPLWIIYSPL